MEITTDCHAYHLTISVLYFLGSSTIERQRSFSLHLSASEPIIFTEKTKEHWKILDLYGTLSKRKAKHFKSKSKGYSLSSLDDEGYNEHHKKRKNFDIFPKFLKSKTSYDVHSSIS